MKRYSEPAIVTVRRATPQDLRELARLLICCFQPAGGVFSCFSPLLTLGVYEDLRTRLHFPPLQYCCLVASQSLDGVGGSQQEIIGTVEIGWRSAHFGGRQLPYLSNLAVLPSYRRQGVARKLLLKCEQVALDWGCGELFLHVLEDNEAAKQLYLGSGYQLQRHEPSLSYWLFGGPRRLFLYKSCLKRNQVS